LSIAASAGYSLLRRGLAASALAEASATGIIIRIESERLKLPAPFGRRIAEPLDADAAGQATFYLVPLPGASASARLNDLFLLGSHRLVCGDATDPAVVRRLMRCTDIAQAFPGGTCRNASAIR
jgi:hypothetical protein